MTNKTLDDVMRRILNDSDIFYVNYVIFDDQEWKELGKQYQGGNFSNVASEINQRINSLKSESNSRGLDRKQRERLGKVIELTEALKDAIANKPQVLADMFSTLDKFGLVKCNLPNMEDYGKIIENHDRPIVEQFFLYKIDKAKPYEKRALRKTLEYLKELYAMNLDVLEIAFLIRKLDSLSEYREVVGYE